MPSIAIVNNEDWLRDFLARALKAEGYAVRTYANTADALTLCEQPADLAILDRTNPPLGGVELFGGSAAIPQCRWCSCPRGRSRLKRACAARGTRQRATCSFHSARPSCCSA